MGSNQKPHATMVAWFLSGVCKDEVDIQRKLEWRQQVASATGQKAETEGTQETWIAWLAAPGQSAWNCNAY